MGRTREGGISSFFRIESNNLCKFTAHSLQVKDMGIGEALRNRENLNGQIFLLNVGIMAAPLHRSIWVIRGSDSAPTLTITEMAVLD